MKITITGIGYVGLSTALGLAKYHDVTAYDVSETVVSNINRKLCPIKENLLTEKLKERTLYATTDIHEAYKEAELIIIAVPTNYDDKLGKFDVSILDDALEKAVLLSDAVIVIKSTVPVGYTKRQVKKWNTFRILFSPEFMREGMSYYDVTNPSRIIVGCLKEAKVYATMYLNIMREISENNPPVLMMDTTDAEAVKLFSNCYLAMRVSFFNELDTYACLHGMNTADVIKGVSLDPRIGDGYQNPSFGFGGYCLPKDTRQLAAQMDNVPGCLIASIPESNDIRIQFIADHINSLSDGVIGVYGIAMKSGSDNARASSVVRVIRYLQNIGRDVLVYDDNIDIDNVKKAKSIEELNEKCDIIIANRKPTDSTLTLIQDKLYTRDVFGGG